MTMHVPKTNGFYTDIDQLSLGSRGVLADIAPAKTEVKEKLFIIKYVVRYGNIYYKGLVHVCDKWSLIKEKNPKHIIICIFLWYSFIS